VRAEPAKAETLLEDLSDLFRHALMEQSDSVTLDDEIVLAQRYLAIEQVRFGDRLQVEWVAGPQGRQMPGCLPCCCSLWWKMRSNTA
jgi:two-component system sensor histidine kinase AlgZ